MDSAGAEILPHEKERGTINASAAETWNLSVIFRSVADSAAIPSMTFRGHRWSKFAGLVMPP